jgi:archaellum component FlaC
MAKKETGLGDIDETLYELMQSIFRIAHCIENNSIKAPLDNIGKQLERIADSLEKLEARNSQTTIGE